MLTQGKKNATFVNVKRITDTDDGQGGFSGGTPSVLYFRVPCRFNAMTEKEIALIADKQDVKAEYKVFLEYRSGIQEGDFLIKTDDNRQFNIKLIMDWDEDKRMMRLAVAEEGRFT